MTPPRQVILIDYAIRDNYNNIQISFLLNAISVPIS